jgi:hypothetical protein
LPIKALRSGCIGPTVGGSTSAFIDARSWSLAAGWTADGFASSIMLPYRAVFLQKA